MMFPVSERPLFDSIKHGLDSFTFSPSSKDSIEAKTPQDISDEAWRMSEQAWIMTGESLRDTFVKQGVIRTTKL